MEYMSVPEARKLAGLRIILSPGGPGPWSEAAKSICYLKRLSYIPVAQEVGGPRPGVVRMDRADQRARGYLERRAATQLVDDQLFLFERLAPEPAMIPVRIDERATMFGYANEICGENGFAWNRRLLQFHYVLNSPKSSPRAVERFGGGARKYLYTPEAVAKAPTMRPDFALPGRPVGVSARSRESILHRRSLDRPGHLLGDLRHPPQTIAPLNQPDARRVAAPVYQHRPGDRGGGQANSHGASPDDVPRLSGDAARLLIDGRPLRSCCCRCRKAPARYRPSCAAAFQRCLDGSWDS